MWRTEFKLSITVTDWRNGKKKNVYTSRFNCINTVRTTSSQVRVLREDPLVRGMTIWTRVRVKLLSTRETRRLEQTQICDLQNTWSYEFHSEHQQSFTCSMTSLPENCIWRKRVNWSKSREEPQEKAKLRKTQPIEIHV